MAIKNTKFPYPFSKNMFSETFLKSFYDKAFEKFICFFNVENLSWKIYSPSIDKIRNLFNAMTDYE